MQSHELNLVFSVEIPGRVGIKKNNRRIYRAGGRTVSSPSSKFKSWESRSMPSVLKARQEFYEFLPIKEKVFAYYEFHFKNNQGLPDVSNCIEGPQDLLESLGVIENDKLIEHLEARRFVGSKPKTVVKFFCERVKV